MTNAKLVHIVDDEEEVCRSTAFLMRIAGHECVYWTSGTAFLEGADLASKGCVILDVRMPGKGGLAIQQELKERRSPLRVIMVSGHGDGDAGRKAIEAGAADFIEKPYDQNSMLAAVRRTLSISDD